MQREDFKEQVAKDKVNHEEQEAAKVDMKAGRSIKRKPEVPKANARNFEEENQRMGVTNVLDLLAGDAKDRQDFAQSKLQGGFIDYSHQLAGSGDHKAAAEGGDGKKKKVDRYLTIQGLLNHPYFTNINTVDVSVIIDDFESFS